MLLGREWTEATVPVSGHVVEVWRDEKFWRWACSCQLHEGYGNVKYKIVAAAERHARASVSG